ncbi:MAG: hypothetical protein AB7V77_01440 [Candidatus Woesearchaeota archaeon]
MNFITKHFNIVETELSFLQENIEFFAYLAVCFFIPFVLGHPQWLVGSIVNCALILGALNLKFEKVLPIILIPSIGVLSAGILFGTYTKFLLYLIPFIWIGNTIIVWGIKYLNLKHKNNYAISLLISSIAKTIFLFSSISVLVLFKVVPIALLTSFGIFQLYTALLGGGLAFGIQKLKKKLI